MFGRLLRRGELECLREEIGLALAESAGNVSAAAHHLGICRRQVVRYLWRLNLWPDLDRIRGENERRTEDEAEIPVLW